MDAVLFKPSIIYDDGECSAKDVLLNKARVATWGEISGTGVEFYYAALSNHRVKYKKYRTSANMYEFELYMEEPEDNAYIVLNVEKINTNGIGVDLQGAETSFKDCAYTNDKMGINLDKFIKAEAKPTGETGSYVWLEGADFKCIILQVEDTVDEINGTSSDSGSLP